MGNNEKKYKEIKKKVHTTSNKEFCGIRKPKKCKDDLGDNLQDLYDDTVQDLREAYEEAGLTWETMKKSIKK